MENGLVYVGKVIEITPIEGADFIVSATVVCGKGGKWKGVVKKADFSLGDKCIVFMPDCLLPEIDEFRFMEKNKWRVKMCRFKGSPSEVLIMGIGDCTYSGLDVGTDVTDAYQVKKYHKPVHVNLQGKAKGEFPSFIPKTDEPNYQRVPELIDAIVGKPYYITEKADGSSTTAYKYKGNFGVCSRNWELERDEENGYWKVAIEYDLEANLPEGCALQWETCGPKIQDNPHGFTSVKGLAFSAYNIEERRYLTLDEFFALCKQLKFPIVPIVSIDDCFYQEGIETLGEGTYSNGKQREGVVVRSIENLLGHKPISFKVINLNYEK